MFPNLNDLHYFQEVCETLNISRASERLGITQPSLSVALRRLEDCLDSQLIIRSKTGVHLTVAGERLRTQSNQLIDQWSQLKNHVHSATNEVQGLYRIGAHPSVARYTLPNIINEALSKNPKLELSLSHDLSRKVTEQVISRSIDFGLVMNPHRHSDLVIKDVLTDEVCLWTAQKPSKLQDVKSSNSVLIFDPSLIQSQSLIKTLNKRGIVFDRELHSDNLEVIVRLTVSGSGIGILPTRVAALMPNKRLKKLPQSPSFKDQLCLIYRADQAKTAASQYIKQLLMSVKQA